MRRPVRVLLAVPSACLLQAYKGLIAGDRELDLVAEAMDAATAVREVRRTEPHVAVLDFHLHDGGGLEAAQSIRRERLPTKVILLSDYDADEYREAARQAGAACLTKTALAALVYAIKSLATVVKEAER